MDHLERREELERGCSYRASKKGLNASSQPRSQTAKACFAPLSLGAWPQASSLSGLDHVQSGSNRRRPRPRPRPTRREP
jgi:hypothetical protein